MRFQPSLSGTLNLSRTNAFFLGGGKALVNASTPGRSSLGVEIVYDSEVQRTADGRPHHPARRCVSASGFPETVRAQAASWPPPAASRPTSTGCASTGATPADNFLIRGTPYNQGRVLKNLLDQGAKPVGDPTQCHAVAIDARAPKFDGGIVTRLDCVPFSIVVNRTAQRFYDEGEDVWPKRYAIWGRLVAAAAGADRLLDHRRASA